MLCCAMSDNAIAKAQQLYSYIMLDFNDGVRLDGGIRAVRLNVGLRHLNEPW